MKKSLLSLAVVAALSSTAFASDVRVSGFMNVVGGQTDQDDGASYRGYDNKYDFQNESLAAIQISGSIADNMSATVQLVAQKQEVGDDIRMEWGFVSYDATDEVRILAGRIRPALFLYSDYLDVGYAYNWVTPPSEVYDQVNITNLDGASVAYNLELDDNTLSTTVYGGNSSDKKVNPNNAASPLNLSFDSIIGAEIALSNDYGKIRAGYIQAKATENDNPLPNPALNSELAMNESAAAFYGVGINVDYEDILFASEYIVRDMDETGSPDISSYYAMLGYKIGDFTPSYTYAVADSDMEVSTSAVAGNVNQIRAAALDDRISHTVGLRYDVNAQAALKLEYNMATVTNSSWAAGTPALIETDADVNTARIALNVIF
ncbi:MAG: hypothetical protein U9Q40_05060 [Campylobacterota bacterium]|nr:hypothetical protein [Campylobacterota bacterium]